jgi:hypothetical protein
LPDLWKGTVEFWEKGHTPPEVKRCLPEAVVEQSPVEDVHAKDAAKLTKAYEFFQRMKEAKAKKAASSSSSAAAAERRFRRPWLFPRNRFTGNLNRELSLQVKLLTPTAKMPERGTPGSAGLRLVLHAVIVHQMWYTCKGSYWRCTGHST